MIRAQVWQTQADSVTEVASLFYSLIESAKLVGVDPVHYLRAAAEAAIREGAGVLPH